MDIGVELAAAVPIIMALVQMIRTAFPDIPNRILPLISLAMAGIFAAIAVATNLGGAEGSSPLEIVITTLMTGLSASGLYSGSKALKTASPE